MPIVLNEIEARILGALIEKSCLTPELYPLSFNSLLNACNQKTSRDPVMSLDAEALGKGLASLSEKGLAARSAGSRVPKFAHAAERLGAGKSPEIIGALALLLLRGAQTAAEIRARGDRLCQFPNSQEAEALLQKLASDPDGPFVVKLARGRYQHLFSGEAPAAPPSPAPDRLARLESRLEALEERCRRIEEGLAPPEFRGEAAKL